MSCTSIYGTGTTGIQFRHPEYVKALPRWIQVDDTQQGQNQVKDKGTDYLPFYGTKQVNKSLFSCDSDWNSYLISYTQLSNDEKIRYSNLLMRAIFYNYVAPTVGGLVGLATNAELILNVGPALEFARDDIDGGNTSLEQQIKRTTELVVKHARSGVLVDFPKTQGNSSQADVNAGIARPYASVYRAEQIMDWGEERVGAITRINMVKLAELKITRAENGFDMETAVQFRVLRLVDGLYVQEVRSDKNEVIEGPFEPKDNAGKRLTEIPFQFFGAVNNDTQVDESKMYDLSVINIGHYINSADYENATWLVGQPIPWGSGFDRNWVEQNMPGGLQIGSGAFIPVPPNEQFGIVQVQPNSMAFEAMGHKEKQMIATGAKMVSPESSFDTATDAAINNQSEISFLQSIVDNVQSGYANVLGFMALFSGSEVNEFSNPVDLEVVVADPQMLAQVIQSWTIGLTAKEDARAYQRSINVLDRTDEEIDEDIENDTSGLLDNVVTINKTVAPVADTTE